MALILLSSRIMPGRRVAPDHLFEALDGRRLRVQGCDWRVQVYGVFEESERRWVQLALDGDRRRVVTMRLASDQPPRQAVRSLSSWLANPVAGSHVLEHVA